MANSNKDTESEDMAGRPEPGEAEARPQADMPVEDAEIVDETDRAAAEETEAPAPVPQPEPRKGGSGVFGGVVGGLIAAALGYTAAQYVEPAGFTFPGTETAAQADDGAALATALAESTDRIAALETRIADLGESVAALPKDTGPVELPQDMTDTLAALGDRLAQIDARLGKLEARPLPTDGAEQVAEAYRLEIQDYESEIEAMRAQLAEQQAKSEELSARVTDVADTAKAEIDEAVTRAALMRINAALDSGGSFAPALADLAGVDVPEALRAVADSGAATLAELRASFPGYARAALRESLKDAADGAPGDRLTAFLRTQLGARSLEPREGNDPDAVLSRAEAAVNSGDLEAALTEIATLPEAGQSEMTPWVDQARAWSAAVAAADALADSLNSN